MKQLVNGYFYKVAIGIAVVVLVGLIAADIWLWQSDDGSEGDGQGTSSEQTVPGLPNRGEDSPSSDASASDARRNNSSARILAESFNPPDAARNCRAEPRAAASAARMVWRYCSWSWSRLA